MLTQEDFWMIQESTRARLPSATATVAGVGKPCIVAFEGAHKGLRQTVGFRTCDYTAAAFR